MRVTLTVKEICERDLWMKFCEMKGISEWARNEGQINDNEEFSFSEEEAIKLGFLTDKRDNWWWLE